MFDEAARRDSSLSLFADEREVAPEVLNSIQVKLSEIELQRRRARTVCTAVGIAGYLTTGC